MPNHVGKISWTVHLNATALLILFQLNNPMQFLTKYSKDWQTRIRPEGFKGLPGDDEVVTCLLRRYFVLCSCENKQFFYSFDGRFSYRVQRDNKNGKNRDPLRLFVLLLEHELLEGCRGSGA